MTTGPGTNSAERNREKLADALHDEGLFKLLVAATHTEGIRGKALHVLFKRIASPEISDTMLLRIVASLSKIIPCFECVEILMSAGPNTNAAGCNRDKLVKAVSAAIHSEEIWPKALDILHKRIASGELSDAMLLRIVVSLSKSTACFELHPRRPLVTRLLMLHFNR
jgi:hypothetical protein